MKTKPHILITNDDGIHAPGIQSLWESLHSIADITVVAPLMEQSCVGLSVTLREPLKIEENAWKHIPNVYSVSGTPADCIKLALNVILKDPPDLVVSGINRGSNAGRNVLYSGTVAGAIEAALHDIPAMAFSCRDYFNPDYQTAAEHIPRMVQHFLMHPLQQGSLLNINFPAKDIGVKGFKMTKQGKEFWGEEPNERFHPVEGHAYYWIGAKLMEFPEDEKDEASDIFWLKKGFATAVPVNVSELTDMRTLNDRGIRFEELFVS